MKSFVLIICEWDASYLVAADGSIRWIMEVIFTVRVRFASFLSIELSVTRTSFIEVNR